MSIVLRSGFHGDGARGNSTGISASDLTQGASDAEVQRLVQLLGLATPAIQRAAKRAVRKAAQRVVMRASQRLAQAFRLQRRRIQARLRLYVHAEGFEQKVWLGLNDMAARSLGTPTRTARGVRVGPHFFEGAFVIRKFGRGVFRREGPDRFPLTLAKLQIDQAGKAALEEAMRGSKNDLIDLLRQEVNFELSRTGR